MKKFFIIVIIIVLVAGVCVITCPNKQAHKDAIMELVNSKLNKELDKSVEADGAVFVSALGSKIIEFVLDNRLEVKNYFVCSIGLLGSEKKTITFGLLGHVFTTISKEEFSNLIDNQN